MKNIQQTLLTLLLVLVTAIAGAADYVEGKNYEVLKNPQPTGDPASIEVLELFWYGCPHCYRLEPYIHDWLQHKPDDVKFVRLPAILGNGWELLAKGFFTAEMLGVLDQVHSELFAAIHEKKEKFRDDKAVRSFFIEHGVKPEDFDKIYNSFAVAVKVNNARLMTRNYAITGVPTLIVNGKYSTSASLAGGNAEVPRVVDFLVARERKTAAAAGTAH